jgi:hypothetical protein
MQVTNSNQTGNRGDRNISAIKSIGCHKCTANYTAARDCTVSFTNADRTAIYPSTPWASATIIAISKRGSIAVNDTSIIDAIIATVTVAITHIIATIIRTASSSAFYESTAVIITHAATATSAAATSTTSGPATTNDADIHSFNHNNTTSASP